MIRNRSTLKPEADYIVVTKASALFVVVKNIKNSLWSNKHFSQKLSEFSNIN